jgi:hypothetical protein
LVERLGFDVIRGDSAWTLLWAKPKSKEHPYHLDNTIPHEAAHAAFDVSIPRQLWRNGGGHYGSRAPDWLDEAAAVWVESDSMRFQRVQKVRDSTPSLAALLTTIHPSLKEGGVNYDLTSGYTIVSRTALPPCEPCTWLPDSLRTKYQVTSVRAFADGHTDTVTTWHANDPRGPTRFEDREFYALAYSLLAFVHDRGGPAAFNELIARYAANPVPRTDVLNGLPGFPDSFDQIEREWRAFLGTVR